MSKSNTQYAIGQSVTVCNPITGNVPVAGVITSMQRGWYAIRVGDEIVSARASSITPRNTPAAIVKAITGVDTRPVSWIDSTAPVEGTVSDDDTAEEKEAAPEHPMAKALREARVRYVKTKRPSGTASADNGDMLARAMRDLEPLEVAALADKVLEVEAGTHAAKYGHLNPGQIRMNSGNRIRAAFKNADAEEQARIMALMGVESEYDEEMDDEEGDE